MEKEKLVEALQQIADITEHLTGFNPTYEIINSIANGALEESK
ncbi:hypothetical protein [Ureibacillus sinduriensis]|nr:hypothetical protein [Ureibacillus sinduriensis]